MKVLKFGGSSVKTPKRIQHIVEILKTYDQQEEAFTVVFSAFGGVTDFLIEMSTFASVGSEAYLPQLDFFKKRHREAVYNLLTGKYLDAAINSVEEGFSELENLLQGVYLVRELSPRTLDYVLSFGERNSAYIITQVLKQNGILADYLDARKIITTNDNFGDAIVDFERTNQKIQQHYASTNATQIVTGFVAATESGLTTTLGRGGSDYTTSIVAGALNASVIEIWTDVDGVMTADPRKVKKAFTIPSMTYAEAMEMSHFGAKVIYPPTLLPALKRDIPLRIKNTFNPSFEGTLISKQSDRNGRAVKGISSIDEVALLTLEGSGMFGVPGIAGRLFGALAEKEINVILITQGSSEHSISFAVRPQEAQKAKQTVENAFKYEIRSNQVEPLKILSDLSIVAVIGENMQYQVGLAGQTFQALGKNGINIVAIAQGSSELNISMIISKDDERKALNALHSGFFLSDTTDLNVFIVGVGLIGGTLINQIKKQAEHLAKNRSFSIKIIGLANSKKMLFEENGINLDNWKANLLEIGGNATLKKFIDKMVEMNLANTIFIDNTANAQLPTFYEEILKNSISIVTPNKIATSSDYLKYLKLKTLAERQRVRFLYETNVGAGLPVITTLNDLIHSGDRILKIEGVLSGSLSFIFNSYKKGLRFSDIVNEAREKGYTEPDPREDLSGSDVRRKLLILARETGLPMESNQIEVENILPKACNEAPSVPEFFEALESANDEFETLRAAAESRGEVLRFIATLKGTKASISLKSVSQEHPFYSLSGSDNMIVFTTERYKERPLVIRGPGAGAEVTAAGVFSEVISIGDYLT